MLKVNLEELARFLVKAKRKTYACLDSMNIEPERPGFKELVYEEGRFYYRDSYTGFFQAPGMEVVRIGGENGTPIWSMSYSGGMLKEFYSDVEFAKQTFSFLKSALGYVSLGTPFRGPRRFEDGEWLYVNEVKGDITRFEGTEKILFRGEEVFIQSYIGGLIVDI